METSVTVTTPADGALASTADDCPIRRLLAAYATTLDLVDRVGPAPLVAVGRRWIAPMTGPLLLPRPAFMLRALTVRHMDAVLAALERRCRRRAALVSPPAWLAGEAAAVTDFRASLQPISWRLRVTGLVLAILVVARALGEVVPRDFDLLTTWLPGQEGITKLLDSTFETFEPSPTNVSAAFDNLLAASAAELLAFALLLGLAAFVVLRPLATAFRLKRMLLNIHPAGEAALRSVPASWSVSRSVGVYALEREALGTVSGRPPREVPLDLLVSLVLAIGLATFYVVGGALVAAEDMAIGFAVLGSLVVYGTPAAIRLAWLTAAWRSRARRGRGGGLIARELNVGWRDDTVRRRSPLLIGLAGMLTPYGLTGWWWWRVSNELRDFGQAHDVPEASGTLKPAVETIMMSIGCYVIAPPFIVIIMAVSRVRAAQVAAGLERPLNPRIVWLAPLFPVLCGLLQRELNRLWDATATPARSSRGGLPRRPRSRGSRGPSCPSARGRARAPRRRSSRSPCR